VKFDIEEAIKNNGTCRNQLIKCSECEIGKILNPKKIDQLCYYQDVSYIIKLIEIYKILNLVQEKINEEIYSNAIK
jgi:hypothetical protein